RFAPPELFFASGVKMSMAFCREAATWSPEEAPRALPRCAARAPAATRIRDNPRAGDARNHRFARHRLLGEARGGRRTTGVGRPGFGAHLGAGGVRDRPRNPRRSLRLCASWSAAPHSWP